MPAVLPHHLVAHKRNVITRASHNERIGRQQSKTGEVTQDPYAAGGCSVPSLLVASHRSFAAAKAQQEQSVLYQHRKFHSGFFKQQTHEHTRVQQQLATTAGENESYR